MECEKKKKIKLVIFTLDSSITTSTTTYPITITSTITITATTISAVTLFIHLYESRDENFVQLVLTILMIISMLCMKLNNMRMELNFYFKYVNHFNTRINSYKVFILNMRQLKIDK